eukprot:6992316-Alexandrium_andersonii.AAC.1
MHADRWHPIVSESTRHVVLSAWSSVLRACASGTQERATCASTPRSAREEDRYANYCAKRSMSNARKKVMTLATRAGALGQL